MFLPQVVIPYTTSAGAQLALPLPLGKAGALPLAAQSAAALFNTSSAAVVTPNLSQLGNELAVGARQDELAKLGSLFGQMLILQRLLELLDVNAATSNNANAIADLGRAASVCTATEPTSAERRQMATLRVPERFHER